MRIYREEPEPCLIHEAVKIRPTREQALFHCVTDKVSMEKVEKIAMAFDKGVGIERITKRFGIGRTTAERIREALSAT